MGSQAVEGNWFHNDPQHRVTLTRGFWMAKTETTQARWESITGNNPSVFIGEDLPVEKVSWEDVQEWLEKMNEKTLLPSGWKWSLPTEAQWEYACRAGAETALGDLDELACHGGNSNYTTNPVGRKKANAWGLHDMHGNVFEWCADWYGDYPDRVVTDPRGAELGVLRVRRGGSWNSPPQLCRSADRSYDWPGGGDFVSGFRPALVPPIQ
jgi:formylglycine-generating enzyme required for sulfatase activity